jgi:hypothetical protein
MKFIYPNNQQPRSTISKTKKNSYPQRNTNKKQSRMKFNMMKMNNNNNINNIMIMVKIRTRLMKF